MDAATGKKQRRDATPKIRLKSASFLQEYFFSSSLNADDTRQPAVEDFSLDQNENPKPRI